MSATATAVQQISTNPQVEEQSETKESLEKLDLFKNRCLAMASIFKNQLEDIENAGRFAVYAWYTQSASALQLQQSNASINLKKCQRDFIAVIKTCIQISAALYDEIDSTNSLDKLYDFLYASLLKIKFFRDEELSLTKDGNFLRLIEVGTETQDENVKNSPIYYYCTRMMNVYREMLDLIAPAIDERQVSFWVSSTVTVTPKSERVATGKFQVIYNTKLSDITTIFNREYQELSEHIIQVGRECPMFSPLIQNTRKKMESVFASVNKLSTERTAIVLRGGFIPREDTRKVFYAIMDFVDTLKDIRKEFEYESKIFEEKFKLKTLKEQQTQKLEIEQSKKPEVAPKLDTVKKETLSPELQKAEEQKKAEETFRAFEEEQRRRLAEYRAGVLGKRKEKDRLKQTMKEQVKTGKTLANSISRTLINNLKTCIAEELQVIQAIINHSTVAEEPVHNVLLKLGFLADKNSSQGYKYKLGPFSATFHPAHAASANAGFLHPDFVSKLRKIFWGVGFDKELIDSFQKRLVKTVKSPANSKGEKNSNVAAAAQSDKRYNAGNASEGKTAKESKYVKAANTATAAATAAAAPMPVVTATAAGMTTSAAAPTSVATNVGMAAVGNQKKKKKKNRKK